MKNLKLTLKSSVAIFLVAIVLCQLTQYVAHCLGIELPEQEQVNEVRKMAGWNLNFILLALQIVTIMPALEELIFRFPTRWLKSYIWWAAISAIFSFAHYIDFLAWANTGAFTLRPLSNAFIALWFCGFAWCWLYRKTKHIWCTMLSHAIFNAVNLTLLFILPEAV